MRTRTAVVGVLIVCLLVGAGAYGLTMGPKGSLTVNWISDTSRPNQVNHHPVVVARANGRTDILAPVSSVAGPNARCSVTMLNGNGTTRWQRSISSKACQIHGIGDPLLADATGNGQLDALTPTTENRLYVYNATDGSTEWTQNLTSFGYGGPIVVTKPRRLVIQPDFMGTVFADHPNGTLAWRHDLNQSVNADPKLVHVPGDSNPDVAIGSTTNVTVLRPDGTVSWRHQAQATWMAKGRLDGHDELVASGGTNITAFDANGTELWKRTDWNRPSLDVIADGNGDGTPEVYVGSGGDTIAALNARTGETEWKTTLSTDANILPAPVVGDLNGDGHLEVVAVTNHGTVHVIDPKNGNVLASYKRDVKVWVHPTVTDYNGDGTDEILVMYGDGRVVSLSYHSK